MNSNHQGASRPEETIPFLPFNFPAKFHVIAITSPDDPSLGVSLPVYQKLIDLSGAEGSVFVPEGGLSLKVVKYFVSLNIKFLNLNFSSRVFKICSPKLQSSITVHLRELCGLAPFQMPFFCIPLLE